MRVNEANMARFEAEKAQLEARNLETKKEAESLAAKLDGEQFILNADLIRYVESRPDTFITLTSGERLVVAETMDDVIHVLF